MDPMGNQKATAHYQPLKQRNITSTVQKLATRLQPQHWKMTEKSQPTRFIRHNSLIFMFLTFKFM